MLGRQAFEKLTAFASPISPRRVTASLNAIPPNRQPLAPAAPGTVVPAPDASFGVQPQVTRH